jgi:dolichol-phosphate mannosyltransferase
MSVIGFVLSFSSLFFGIFFLVRKFLMNHVVAGWTGLMVVLLGSTGMILFCLGILGEYVSRLISSSENHPAFVLREKTKN